MHGGSERRIFDADERELIRKKLNRYMEDNGFGVPKLAELIEASHPQRLSIPLSTLQRFLAGRSKNEVCVAQCNRFAEGLTVSDPVAKLGERLSIFYGAANTNDYAGVYSGESVHKNLNFTGSEESVASEIIISADAGFWRVIERATFSNCAVVYDGVLVCSGASAVVVLKDRLAGLARNYLLGSEGEKLCGCGVTANFNPRSQPELDLDQIAIRLSKK